MSGIQVWEYRLSRIISMETAGDDADDFDQKDR